MCHKCDEKKSKRSCCHRKKHCEEPEPAPAPCQPVPKCGIMQAMALLPALLSDTNSIIPPKGLIPFNTIEGCIPSSSIQMVNGLFQIQECGWYEIDFSVVLPVVLVTLLGANIFSAAVELVTFGSAGCASACGCPTPSERSTSEYGQPLRGSAQQIVSVRAAVLEAEFDRVTLHGHYLLNVQQPCTEVGLFNALDKTLFLSPSTGIVKEIIEEVLGAKVPWSAYISIVKTQAC
jgi:hypothetical protein